MIRSSLQKMKIGRVPVRNLKPWVLMNSWDPQILTFVASLLKIIIKVGLISIFVHFFSRKYITKFPKSVGASTHKFEKHGC